MWLAISFLLSKIFQLFVKKKCSLLYPDWCIYPDRNLSPAGLVDSTISLKILYMQPLYTNSHPEVS